MPTNESICDLLELVLQCNNFQFNGENYVRKGGTAICTKVAPSPANIFMADFEDKFVSNYHLKLFLYKWFIDDVVMIWPRGRESLNKFIGHLNQCHESIKFTAEISENEITFLDTKIHPENDGTLWTDLYCKPTDSHDYLHFTSAPQPQCKRSWPYSQFIRVRCICSKPSDFLKHGLSLLAHFLHRGYSSEHLKEAFLKAWMLSRSDLLNYREKEEQGNNPLFLISDYNPGFPSLKPFVTENWDLLTRSQATKILGENRVIFGYWRPKNLKDELVRAKLPTLAENKNSAPSCKTKNKCKTWNCQYCKLLNKTGWITSTHTGREYTTCSEITCQSSNLIYCITCKKYWKQYVGQTGDPISKIFDGHKGTINRQEMANDIGRHFNLSDHSGVRDMEITVLDFIHAPPKSDFAVSLRLQIEFIWIHRLRTMLPMGINTITTNPI